MEDRQAVTSSDQRGRRSAWEPNHKHQSLSKVTGSGRVRAMSSGLTLRAWPPGWGGQIIEPLTKANS